MKGLRQEEYQKDSSNNEVSPKLEEGPFKDVVENVIPGLVYGDE